VKIARSSPSFQGDRNQSLAQDSGFKNVGEVLYTRLM
jgi:hypothetical protein